MAAPDGWLSEGHGLDLTMLATAANFETRTNGATHMGNDDCTIFDGMAHLKIIDVSCPQQMLVADEVDHGGQPRPALRARDAHAVGGALRQRLHVRVRQGPRPARERRRRARSSSAAAAACTRRWPPPTQCAAQRRARSASSTCRRSTRSCCSQLYESGKLVVPRRAEQRLHPAEPAEGAVPPRPARAAASDGRPHHQHARRRTAGRSSSTPARTKS